MDRRNGEDYGPRRICEYYEMQRMHEDDGSGISCPWTRPEHEVEYMSVLVILTVEILSIA